MYAKVPTFNVLGTLLALILIEHIKRLVHKQALSTFGTEPSSNFIFQEGKPTNFRNNDHNPLVIMLMSMADIEIEVPT